MFFVYVLGAVFSYEGTRVSRNGGSEQAKPLPIRSGLYPWGVRSLLQFRRDLAQKGAEGIGGFGMRKTLDHVGGQVAEF